MKPVVIVFLFIILIISCQNNNIEENNQIKTFNIKKLPKVTNVKLSDLGFIDIEYIPLETSKKSLIQRTINIGSYGDRVIVGNNSIIIKEFNNILKFRSDGTFVAKIGTQGRGPNEFLTCHDVETDKKGQIYIVDGWNKKLFIYSEIGEFIKTVNFPLSRAVEFRFVEGAFLCYSQNNLGNVENSYNLIDTTGKIIKSFPNQFPFTKYSNDAYGFMHENLFYRFNDRLFKKEVYSDTVYTYEKLKFKPHLIIDVGEKLITPEARSQFAGLDLAKRYISPRNLFEFGDYVYYEFTFRFELSLNGSISENYCFIGSKKEDINVLIKQEEGLINDLDGGTNILPLVIKDNNTIVAWVDASRLKAHITSDAFKRSNPKNHHKKKELIKLANSLKETDNPVLILVRLKK